MNSNFLLDLNWMQDAFPVIPSPTENYENPIFQHRCPLS